VPTSRCLLVDRYAVHSGGLRRRHGGHHGARDGLDTRRSSRDLQGYRRTARLCRSVYPPLHCQGADRGTCVTGGRPFPSPAFPSPRLPSRSFLPLLSLFPPHLPFPLEVGSPLNQLESFDERRKPPSGVRG